MLDRLRQALAPRYRIDRELGSGGMATVYLGTDATLNRQVAVKVLRPELIGSVGPERFLQEIQTTAQLDHPYVVPLLDSGAKDGLLYYVMPYVEGESLRDRLDREAQLPIEDALKIARQVGDALSYAHDRGIIHRDIKPANILLSAGQARVADFGIAKALKTAGDSQLTQTGFALGTVQYMSPEQSEGEDVDERSDLYSLATVVYEMLAGEPPFTGANAAAVLAKRLTQPVPRISALRDTVPPSVDAALTSGLAKLPVDRFRTISEFLDVLEGRAAHTTAASEIVERAAALQRRRKVWLPVAGAFVLAVALFTALQTGFAAEVERVAVLPVENLGDASYDHITDGIQDALISDLARVQPLSVLGRGSVERYRDIMPSAGTIGADIGADAIVRASASVSGDSVEFRVRLEETATEVVRWDSVFHAPLSEVLSLQSRVAGLVAERLGLSAPFDPSVAGDPSAQLDPAMVEAYLQGRFQLNRGDNNAARRYLEQATDLDPTFAPAFAWLALLHTQSIFFNVPPDSAFARGKEAARRAIDLDPDLAEAYSTLGFGLAAYDWNWEAADSAYRRSVELNPSSSLSQAGYGFFLSWRGQHAEAVVHAELAEDLEPGLAIWPTNTSAIHFIGGEHDQAIAKAREALAIDPNYAVARHRLALGLAGAERYEDAMDVADQMSRTDPSALAIAGWVYGVGGRTSDAESMLEELLELDRAANAYLSPAFIAWVYIGLDDLDNAFYWASLGIGERDPHMVLLREVPIYAPLRADARFQRLLAGVSTG